MSQPRGGWLRYCLRSLRGPYWMHCERTTKREWAAVAVTMAARLRNGHATKRIQSGCRDKNPVPVRRGFRERGTGFSCGLSGRSLLYQL